MCVHIFRDQWDAVWMYYQTFWRFVTEETWLRRVARAPSRTVTTPREQRGSKARDITQHSQCYYFTSPRTVQTTQGSWAFETVTSFVNITSLARTTIDVSYEKIALSEIDSDRNWTVFDGVFAQRQPCDSQENKWTSEFSAKWRDTSTRNRPSNLHR